MPWCRSFRRRSCSTCSTAVTRIGAAIRPIASSATRRRKRRLPTFALGSAGAGLGATTATLKGGVGSASATTPDGVTVGALVVVNAVGTSTIGDGAHFWAAPFEQNKEFGGRGWPAQISAADLALRAKGGPGENTTMAVIATDATAHQSAVQAPRGHGAGRPRPRHLSGAHPARRRHRFRGGDRRQAACRSALRSRRASACSPPMCWRARSPAASMRQRALPFPGALPSWKDKFGK